MEMKYNKNVSTVYHLKKVISAVAEKMETTSSSELSVRSVADVRGALLAQLRRPYEGVVMPASDYVKELEAAIVSALYQNIPEGKNLGNKLKMIEEAWVNNNFQLSAKQINKIINR